MHIHARSKAEQSEAMQRPGLPETASSNGILERQVAQKQLWIHLFERQVALKQHLCAIFERQVAPKQCPCGVFERQVARIIAIFGFWVNVFAILVRILINDPFMAAGAPRMIFFATSGGN